MNKLLIFSDLHGNIESLNKIIEIADKNDCTEIINLGDSITIGPYSNECMDIIRKSRIIMIKGNHEEYLCKGIIKNELNIISESEYEHQKYIHSIITDENKKYIMKLPESIEMIINGIYILFVHGPTENDNNGNYKKYINLKNKTIEEIKGIFNKYKENIIFFGHTHSLFEVEYQKHIINPGSAGCGKDSNCRFTVCTINEDKIIIEHHKEKYDKKRILDEMEKRKIPGRKEIINIFY